METTHIYDDFLQCDTVLNWEVIQTISLLIKCVLLSLKSQAVLFYPKTMFQI